MDVYINGHEVAIGLLGVSAPFYNTVCGIQATAALQKLVKGGIHLDDDTTVQFDSRLRRMYRGVALDGTDIAESLARDGVAIGDGHGQKANNVFRAELEARAAGRGCAWQHVPAPQQDGTGRFSRVDVGDTLSQLARGIGQTFVSAAQGLRPAAAEAAPVSAPLATTLPAGFTQDVIASGITQPTNMAWLPDGRILILGKTGQVWLVKNGVLQTTPFIDIRDHVNSYFDHGLLGVAVDPNFATNGFVYLLYTYEDNVLAPTAPKAGRFTRVTAVGDTASPSSEVTLLGSIVGGSCNNYPDGTDCIPNDNLSHTEGAVKFAPDGSIFLTLGDGASFSTVDPMALRAQDIDNLAGKVIHILPNGLGAPENPFYNGDPTANRSKVWAYGVRNAYRFNLRPSNGHVVIGDVGWNDIEEVDVVPPGANLGWPCYEGPLVQSGYQGFSVCQALYPTNSARPPLTSYTHSNGSTAVTGGAFYTGTVYPAQFQGAYFFGDYGQSFLRYIQLDANDNIISGPTDFGVALDGPVAINTGPDGNLYYIAINTGELRRIRFAGNAPPNAVASATPNNGLTPLTVQFSSAGSNDPENETLSFSWDFGDGTPASTLASPSHQYTTNGTYTATLTVTDAHGSGTATTRVVVGNRAPTATITAPSSSLTYKVGDVINFAGSGNDPETGALPPANLAWQVIVHHCPQGSCHTHFLLSAVGTSGSFTVPDHGDDVYFEIDLTATDNVGLTGTASVNINPLTSQITLAATPAGMQVIYDGTQQVAPLVHTSVVGSSHSIDTPSPQTNNTFASWSDGGAQHHNIIVPATNATYTATFNVATANSLALSGTGAYANAPHNPELNTTGDWTIEAWFKDESPGGSNHDRTYIVMKGAGDVEGEASYMVGVAWNGIFAGERTNWNDQLLSANISALTINTWHHVAAVLTASTRQLTIYIDGVQSTQGTLAALSPTGSAAGVYIGRNGSGNGPWRGKLDDVRIWNVARTQAQIQSSFQSELAAPPPGLVANWKFDEGTGTIAGDSTATQENATLFSGATWSADVGNGPPPPPPPTAITNVTATNVTNGSAVITWTTNNPADSEVEFGTTTAYGQSSSQNPALVTSHSQQITSLVASTLYHYRVRSRDGGGTLVISPDATFTTAAPPPPTTITGPVTGLVTNVAAQVSWTTNNPADTQVDYGTTTAYGSTTTRDVSLVTSHAQTLTSLTPNTLYHYRARSLDAGGTLVLSADATFTTTNAPPAFSLALSGTGYAEAPAPLAAKLNITGDWTVETWFKDESPGGYNHDFAYLVMKGNTDLDSESPYLLGVQYNNLFAGGRTGFATQTINASLLATTANAWHHVAATFASSTRQVTIYLDGVQVAQGTLPSRTTTGNNRPLEIGRNGNGANTWRGKIDDIRIWNVVRTPAQIAASYATELSAGQAGLVANWLLNDGTGTVATDSTASPANAILNGGATWSTDVGNGPPPPPPPTTISAVASANVTNGSAQITWLTNNPASSQVRYGTTTAYGSTTTLDATLVTSHGQQLAGLSASTLYHYQAVSTDAGGTQVTSGDFTFTTTAPPPPTTISGLTAGNLSNTGALITWTTNNPADTQVEYGTTTAYGTMTTRDPTLATSHSQSLSGLAANTLYHYRARSTDAGGTLVLSPDATFTTTNAPAANSLALNQAGYAEAANATKLNVTGDWTLESWFKDENLFTGYNHDAFYIVMKGNTDANGEAPYFMGIAWNTVFAGERTNWTNFSLSAPIGALVPATWHHLAATMVSSTRTLTLFLDGVQVAQGVLGGQSAIGNALPVEIGRNGNGSGAFRGKVDDVRIWNVVRTPAQISANYAAELATAPAGLVGNWKFDEGVGTSAADATASPQNATLLGGAAWSGDVGNGPPPPPPPTTITNVLATNVTNGTATITWTTNNLASSQVRYGTTASYGSTTALDSTMVTSHSVLISGLAASTLYHYQAASTDAGGTAVSSSDFTFTTTAPPPPTTITALTATGISNTGATITWTTNNPANSQVDYGTTASYGSSTALDASMVTSHSVALSGLVPNTVYHYRARSTDAGGTLVLSTPDQTFTTTNAPAVNSLLLNGAGYAQAPDNAELNITGDWTLEAWFKDETAGGFNHDFTYIVLKGNTDQVGEAPFMMGIAWNTLFAGGRTNWTNWTLSGSLAATNPAAWHHAAATFVASTRTLTLYLDGAQMATGVLGARTTTGNTMPVQIGNNGNLSNAFRGKIDDVRIWNVARTAAQIGANYLTEFSTTQTNLVANWRFNEGTGTTAGDLTTPAENATLFLGAGFSTDVHP
ncbi:MAG TPA: LamG-like jellyroll fold domain-containing protein [Candidatus Acidoferrales bacterium]|nr:LamG-like jellyroll fold domain-containing protein [Candidatus Acidoferrales bacterium]